MYVITLFSAKETDMCLEAVIVTKFKVFKYTDFSETRSVSLLLETVFVSETPVYLNHLTRLSSWDFIEISIIREDSKLHNVV